MVQQMTCPIEVLKDALSERMSTNTQYSLRAFARDLKISAQQLSNFMNGKKGLSIEVAGKIADRLQFSAKEKQYFQDLIQSKFGRSKAERMIANAKLASLRVQDQGSFNLSNDAFRVIADWYHFALVELLRVKSTQCLSARAIARRLGIPELELAQAFKRLARLEIISEHQNRWKVEKTALATTDGAPSEAIRKFHRQVLEKALTAIPLQSTSERYVSTSMLAVRPEDQEDAEKMIREFRSKFTKKMTLHPGSEVYALGIQYFRLTNQIEGE